MDYNHHSKTKSFNLTKDGLVPVLKVDEGVVLDLLDSLHLSVVLETIPGHIFILKTSHLPSWVVGRSRPPNMIKEIISRNQRCVSESTVIPVIF